MHKHDTPSPHPGRRALIAGLLAAFAATGVTTSASAQQNWPQRPVRLVVGYSAGGGVDAVARLVAPRLSELLGQQVVVDNRTGAAGLIAGDTVARAAPDGYTLMLGDSSLLIAQYLQPKMSFDPVKAFTPVASLFTLPLVIVTANDFPAKTPAEFVSLLKKNPGRYSFATSGVGTVHHLGFEMLKGQTGAYVVHIPYRGAAQIVPDVMSGQVPIGVVSAASAIAQARAGKLRALAVMNPVKLQGGEDIAPLSDALPGFSAVPRLYVLAPAGTPAPIVERLSDSLRKVMDAPDIAQAAAAQGAVPAYMPAGPLAADIARESAAWGKVIREQKISNQ
ncbi:tripartite tricarboxylate transporter substrate binding protein [Hydrogenophaga sp. YM1]|uniref:Bug family tripartite tricarboxylate transporter substrate binding protein n=1 Tax=Hydrogenophaga TaxID=47420 RepID=UPI000868A058|nr:MULTISPECIES: tripartite tricarboxylate transporter substrate-binding protein [unclassified Hydrogenophaga]MBN9369654.1 tripartite tricarboxylate transporter substrate binding protein [Hydrogenophaga sp.]ODT31879.1 MAG: ABC transporter substrate-binding protein [Hydrogenophaga sp. SCN 70-13]OJV68190.1 MAG: ABC transporter substrate-binding protein [Hydrogenophaga sp. 70-12]QRR33242.1 tripartite tricarboxylate transporter substrate binding protein [Hydrogenophaga sp. YM1]